MKTKPRKLLLCLTTILSSGLGAPALAQSAPPTLPAGISPIRSPVDENGVDLGNGGLEMSVTDLTIGQDGAAGLQHTRHWVRTAWHDGFAMLVTKFFGTLQTVVSVGNETFTFADGNQSTGGGPYTNDQGNGATLTENSTSYTLTTADGRTILFDKTQLDPSGLNSYENVGIIPQLKAVGTSMAFANGEKVTLSYKRADVPSGTIFFHYLRLQSVNSNRGYQLKYQYESNDALASSGIAGWTRISKITGINNSTELCDPAADACTLFQAWPSVNYAFTAGSITPPVNSVSTSTDSLGRVTRYSFDPARNLLVGVKPPSSATDTVSIAYATGTDLVSSFTRVGAGTWTYAASNAVGLMTITRTDPLGNRRTTVTDSVQMVTGLATDELGRTTSTLTDSMGRVTRITEPQGNSVQFLYDARGNVRETRQVARPGSGLADIVTTATFDFFCFNLKTCNKPISTTDAKGNVTDFSYDPVHGGVVSVTLPAPVAGGIRPQLRTSYSPLQAYFKNSTGNIVASGAPVWLPIATSTCQTQASCAGTADEVKTTISYGVQLAGNPNNLLPTAVTSGSGDGLLSATTGFAYDNVGNRVTVDGPIPGTSDTTRTRYDAVRQVTGVVGPDPDGSLPRLPVAQRFSYNADGQVTLAELGNVANPSDVAWAAFSSQQQVATSYDVNARPVKQELKSGGITYALTQTSYDALGRVTCTAQRMDPAQWASQSSACTVQATGPDGPDRVSRNIYDAAGQLVQVQTALATATQANEATSTFTANGKLATLKDAEGNLTDYSYDGHDRLATTRYPSATVKGTVNPADYEQLTYDANGNVTQKRLRDGQAIGFAYDRLNRMTVMDRPGTAPADPDITYTYDNLGRLLLAIDTNGQRGQFSYDALSRKLTETSLWATTGSQYDLAGRRTRLTWGDGFYVNYDYDNTGSLKSIRENGAASGIGVLARYTYDNLGRRTTLIRGNGTVTSYAFDPVSRLSSLTQDLAGTASDLTINGFAYNPASQIKAQTRSNDAYAWAGAVGVNLPYGVNGRNQLTSAGATALGYDGRGNLTSSGGTTYSYNSLNQLTAGPAPGSFLPYDPLGRLNQIYTESRALDYDGVDLITEYAPGLSIARRYVHGPGEDEPLVWYEGAGTADRRFLHADERGSIIAVTNASGATIGLNAYDEYGVPAASNLGRFQYTGQAWLPELGMYYYKARIYDPKLGRFMQTDPVGYAAGLNLYNYVASDPVNLVDPSGLLDVDLTVTAILGGGLSFDTGFGDLVGTFSGVGFGFGGLPANATPARPARPAPGKGMKRALCPTPSRSLAGSIADGAEDVGFGADAVTVGALAFGLASAPTGAGPIGAGLVAGGAKAVGSFANVVGGLANLADGNFVGAAGNAVSFFAGNGAGRVATRLLTRGRMFGTLTAQGERMVAGANASASLGSQAGMNSMCRPN